MSYIEKEKLPDETIRLDTYGHWICFVQPIAIVPIMLAGWVMTPRFLGSGDPSDFGYIPSYPLFGATSLKALGIILLLSIGLGLYAWLRYMASEYSVTDFRTVDKQGLIFRHTGEIPIAQIESVHADQSIPGRILGYGSVTIVGTGETKQNLKLVPNPNAFRAAAMQEMARFNRK